MLKATLLALLVLFNSSLSADGTKRLLLQAAPPGQAAPPQAVQTQAPVTPVQTQPPQPVQPVQPVQPQVNPQVPQQPGTGTGTGQGTPGQAAPGAPGAPGATQWVPPPGWIPPPPMPGQQLPQYAMPLAEAKCEIPYGMPGSCAYRNRFQRCPATAPPNTCGPITYDRIMENFKLDCPIPYGCYGSEININMGGNPMFPMGVRKIHSISFSEPNSGQSATLNIRNQQNPMMGGGNAVELSDLDCSGVMGCTNLKLNLWGVSLNDVNCPQPGNCGGCTANFYTNTRPGCQNVYEPNPFCLIETKPCWGY